MKSLLWSCQSLVPQCKCVYRVTEIQTDHQIVGKDRKGKGESEEKKGIVYHLHTSQLSLSVGSAQAWNKYYPIYFHAMHSFLKEQYSTNKYIVLNNKVC